MAKPRPQTKARPWTRADHEENSRQIQANADRRLCHSAGRRLGLSGREIAALGRMLDDRIAAALRAHSPLLIDKLKAPAEAKALQGALFDLISDDVVEMFQILTGQETTRERSDEEETARSGSEDATFEQRDFYGSEAEETET